MEKGLGWTLNYSLESQVDLFLNGYSFDCDFKVQIYLTTIWLLKGVQDQFSYEQGILVLINNVTVDPMLFTNGISVKPGTKTNMAITKKTSVRTSTSKEPCRTEMDIKDSDSIYYRFTKSAGPYKREYCRDVYIQIEHIIKKCGCLGSYFSLSYPRSYHSLNGFFFNFRFTGT